jgi:superfamily I DNA/RNA helicase
MNDDWWRAENQMDDDQLRICAAPVTEDHLVVGPPGSGKTNILVLKARQLRKTGKANIQVLVSTRSMREILVSGALKYNLELDKIKTIDRWMFDFLREHQVTPADGKYEDAHPARVKQCMTIAKGHKDLFEGLFIDEGQDCSVEEVDLFRQLGKVCFVTADHRQSIYRGRAGIDAWRNRIARQRQTNLRYHYRNGQAICELADQILKPADENELLLPSMRYKESESKSTITVEHSADTTQQIEKVIAALKNQLRAYNRDSDLIGVITPRHDVLTPLIAALKATEYANLCIFQERLENEPCMEFSPGKRIFVSTIHSAKGLEARALHIVAAEDFHGFPLERNLIYTAVTRAKTSLTIHHSAELPPILSDALLNCQGSAAKQPHVRDIFREFN